MAVATEGVAGKDSFECEPATFEGSVFLQGFYCVLRAAGGIAALRTQQGREELLVKPYDVNKYFTDHDAPFFNLPMSLSESFFTVVFASSKLSFSLPVKIRKQWSCFPSGIL